MQIDDYEADPGDDLGWSADGRWTLRRPEFRTHRFAFEISRFSDPDYAAIYEWTSEIMGTPLSHGEPNARWTTSSRCVFHFREESDFVLFKLRWF